MHLIRHDESGFKERITGEYDRTEDILVGPELTEACVAATVRMKRGFETEVHAHDVITAEPESHLLASQVR